jgi:hypothetical protein
MGSLCAMPPDFCRSVSSLLRSAEMSSELGLDGLGVTAPPALVRQAIVSESLFAVNAFPGVLRTVGSGPSPQSCTTWRRSADCMTSLLVPLLQPLALWQSNKTMKHRGDRYHSCQKSTSAFDPTLSPCSPLIDPLLVNYHVVVTMLRETEKSVLTWFQPVTASLRLLVGLMLPQFSRKKARMHPTDIGRHVLILQMCLHLVLCVANIFLKCESIMLAWIGRYQSNNSVSLV